MTGNDQPSVAIIGGFSEGRHHVSKLARALAGEGFVVVKDAAEADSVVAHSGGSYLLPPDTEGKLILLINPPAGYTSSLSHHVTAKVKQDFHFHWSRRRLHHFLYKNLWNAWYVPARIPHNVRMARRAAEFAKVLPKVSARKVVVIVNKHDPWASNLAAENLPAHSSYSFLSLEGPHDDVWIHPRRYVDVLKCLYER